MSGPVLAFNNSRRRYDDMQVQRISEKLLALSKSSPGWLISVEGLVDSLLKDKVISPPKDCGRARNIGKPVITIDHDDDREGA